MELTDKIILGLLIINICINLLSTIFLEKTIIEQSDIETHCKKNKNNK
jgi:hypothetical protein